MQRLVYEAIMHDNWGKLRSYYELIIGVLYSHVVHNEANMSNVKTEFDRC